MKNYPFTKEDLQELTNQGLTQKQIGEKFGYSTKSIGRIFKKFGVIAKRTAYIQNFIILKNSCQNCGKLTKNPSFCSRSCSNSYTNKNNPPKRKITRKCSKCNCLVKSCKHNLCEFHWQEYQSNKIENIQNLTLFDYWSKKSLQNLHISSKNAHIRGLARSWNKDLIKLPCAKCKYDKHVELCHIKSLKSFPETATIIEVNGKNNIIQLCPNCHWEFDKGLFNLQDINWSPR